MIHRLVSERSKIRIRTFAEGLLARLAHDLELECRSLEGEATLEDGRVEGRIAFPVGGIEVSGTLRNGVLDPAGLSTSERRDCLAKMRAEVFRADQGTVRVVATSSGTASITLPDGRALCQQVTLAVDLERAHGSLELALSALGVDPIKGPMNAFRVRDRLLVLFDLVFVGSDQ